MGGQKIWWTKGKGNKTNTKQCPTKHYTKKKDFETLISRKSAGKVL
jgi:hypothetical protein